MAEEISSISFQEDFIVWTELKIENNKIELERAVSESLPVSINFNTLQDASSHQQISDHLKTIIEKNNLSQFAARVSIPGYFALIKKIQLDSDIPVENFPDIAQYEFEKSIDDTVDQFMIYLPDYNRTIGKHQEKLAVGIRKNVLNFFDDIFKQLNIRIESISPNCFNVEDSFRKIYPDKNELSVLLGWQRRGHDVIISDGQNFVNYNFRPYNSNLDPIEQIEEEELLSSFDIILEEIKHPTVVEQPIYNIESIYCYGFHFKPEWLEMIKAQVTVPAHQIMINESSPYQIVSEKTDFSSDKIFQIFEPISNIF